MTKTILETAYEQTDSNKDWVSVFPSGRFKKLTCGGPNFPDFLRQSEITSETISKMGRKKASLPHSDNE